MGTCNQVNLTYTWLIGAFGHSKYNPGYANEYAVISLTLYQIFKYGFIKYNLFYIIIIHTLFITYLLII